MHSTPRPQAGAALGVIEQLHKAIETYGSRMELLHRACRSAELTMPGVGAVEYIHPLAPAGEKALGYLGQKLRADPGLARAVQVALFRYHEARREAEASANRLTTAAGLDEAGVAALRQKIYYLTHMFLGFSGDALLAQLFPAPDAVRTSPEVIARARAATATTDFLARQQARDEQLARARRLAANLAPRLERVRAVLAALARPVVTNVKELMDPAARAARLAALSVAHDAAARALLEEAIRACEALDEAIRQADATGDVAPLAQATLVPGQLAARFARVPMLADVFPPLAKAS